MTLVWHDGTGIVDVLTVSKQREVVRRGRGRGRQWSVGRRVIAQRAHQLEALPKRRTRLRVVAPALLQ